MNISASSPPLINRNAFVTGAGSGIGAATALELAREGAALTVVGRRPEPIQQIAAATGGTAIAADVTDPEALRDAFEQACDANGPADLVVANAGAMLAAPFDAADPAEWRRMMEVNVLGAATTARLAIPDLLTRAAEGYPADLVLVSSIGAHLVMDDYAMYMSSKAAVTHLARNLRSEFGPRGVRVRAIEPGMTKSELGNDMADAGARQRLSDFGRQVPPIDAARIAEAIAWSCSLPANTNAAAIEVLPTIQG